MEPDCDSCIWYFGELNACQRLIGATLVDVDEVLETPNCRFQRMEDRPVGPYRRKRTDENDCERLSLSDPVRNRAHFMRLVRLGRSLGQARNSAQRQILLAEFEKMAERMEPGVLEITDLILKTRKI